MPQHALIEQRPWLLASLIAGISYWFVADSWVPGLFLIAWKGAGVGLLAVYAWRHHPVADAHRIALVLALGALGDMVLVVNFTGGAAAFLLGHLAAITLYGRHRRAAMAGGERLTMAALLLAVPMASFALTGRADVAFYALGLGGMAAAAFASDFPRSQVALGGALFAMSDLLIFAQMGPLADSAIPRLLIWPLYYFGQFLIAIGVIGALRRKGAFTAP